MNRAEATPVDGSRSTTGPGPSTGIDAPLPAVRLRPPAPAGPPTRNRAAVVPHRHEPAVPHRHEPDIRTDTGVTVTRRATTRRGAVATRRVVGL